MSAHAPVHGEREEGETDKTDPQRMGEPGPRDRERERAGEENRCRQVGPTEQRAREGGRARGRTAADRRGPSVRRRGRAGARPSWA